MNKCIFSVDVEDWFHILGIPSLPSFSEWDFLPSRVEKNFIKLLDIFDEKRIKTTCFFLGWIAERFPNLVREAYKRGHEVASHGYRHELVYKMEKQNFFQDILKTKKLLEDIISERVKGYRAAGFSILSKIPWFFEMLVKAGYLYDSSVFPAPREYGGIKTKKYAPYKIRLSQGCVWEFPLSVVEFMGIPVYLFGGGYLRFFPYFFIKSQALRIIKENRPVIFYIHPREIDPYHPRLPMNLKRKFKSYVNLKSVEKKIKK